MEAVFAASSSVFARELGFIGAATTVAGGFLHKGTTALLLFPFNKYHYYPLLLSALTPGLPPPRLPAYSRQDYRPTAAKTTGLPPPRLPAYRRRDSRPTAAVIPGLPPPRLPAYPAIICLLLFCILTTSKVISGQVPTCDSGHSWRLHTVAPLGNQIATTMIQFPTQSHYFDTESSTGRYVPCIRVGGSPHLQYTLHDNHTYTQTHACTHIYMYICTF